MKTPKNIKNDSVKGALSYQTYYLFLILKELFGNCSDNTSQSIERAIQNLLANQKINNTLENIVKSYTNYNYKIAYTINNDNISNDKNIMFIDCLSDYNFYSKCYEKNILDKNTITELPFYYGAAKNIKNKEIDELYFLGDFDLGSGSVKKETIVNDISVFNNSLTCYSTSYSGTNLNNAQVISKISKYESYNSKNFSELTPFNIKTYMNLDFDTNGLSGLMNKYGENVLNILFLQLDKKEQIQFSQIFLNLLNQNSFQIVDFNSIALGVSGLAILNLYAYILKKYNLKESGIIEDIYFFKEVQQVQASALEEPIDTSTISKNGKPTFQPKLNEKEEDDIPSATGLTAPTIVVLSDDEIKEGLIKIFETRNNLNVNSEVVGYLIEKKIGSNVVEKNYFSADNKLDLITFIDTRIKNSIVNTDEQNLENSYVYSFKQILCVYAYDVNYKFKSTISKEGTKKEIRLVSYELVPSPYLVKKELTDRDVEVSVFDDPPLFPDVKFISDVGVNNKIRIFMNHNVGSHISIPKYLNDREKNYFKQIHALQKSLKYRQLIDDKVLFREDDVGNKYEIYKIEHYPESYSDFDGNLIRIPDSEFIAPSYTYFDLVEPNKKYYYMFRTKDVHNQLSDMSYIYEVELFNDEGVIIPNIKIIEPRIQQPNKIPFKKFARKVKIRPNLGQLLYFKNGDTDKYGASQFGSILQQNLCLRVTSKQTGRIVEYKFKFVTSKQTPQDTREEQNKNC
jgi:hypothetical protein